MSHHAGNIPYLSCKYETMSRLSNTPSLKCFKFCLVHWIFFLFSRTVLDDIGIEEWYNKYDNINITTPHHTQTILAYVGGTFMNNFTVIVNMVQMNKVIYIINI